MGAVDPTYPLFPAASILAAVMLWLVLLTSFVRQNWNLGLVLLCFWLSLQNLVVGVDAIIWSDNADIKYYVWCDIACFLQNMAIATQPMTTCIIARRLYLIASLKSIDLPSTKQKRWNQVIEWTAGVIIPVLNAGPLGYLIQTSRFDVIEGYGCSSDISVSILMITLGIAFNVIPPLVSTVVYCPKVMWTFYRQRRDVNQFLHSSNSISRQSYFRVFAVAVLDTLFTLPMGVVASVFSIMLAPRPLPFYYGWKETHSDWQPSSISHADVISGGRFSVFVYYWSLWSGVILSFYIFGLFGLTPEARASYQRIIYSLGVRLGWKPAERVRDVGPELEVIAFGEPAGMGEITLGSWTSFVDGDRCYIEHEPQHVAILESPHKNSTGEGTLVGLSLVQTTEKLEEFNGPALSLPPFASSV
ncbi:unnamed protein product [Peniophora sp. CBMAI 1063]|nr:unnamed protein product [Peniophora sp. CBMAI 1063]